MGEPGSSRHGSLTVRSTHPLMFCTETLLMGHYEWTITVYENGKFLLGLSLNNYTESIKK